MIIEEMSNQISVLMNIRIKSGLLSAKDYALSICP